MPLSNKAALRALLPYKEQRAGRCRRRAPDRAGDGRWTGGTEQRTTRRGGAGGTGGERENVDGATQQRTGDKMGACRQFSARKELLAKKTSRQRGEAALSSWQPRPRGALTVSFARQG